MSNFELLDVAKFLSKVLENALLQKIFHAFALSKIKLLKASLGRVSLLERGEESIGDLSAGLEHGNFAFLNGEVACLL